VITNFVGVVVVRSLELPRLARGLFVESIFSLLVMRRTRKHDRKEDR
jgi:hypothetical protein